MVVGTLVILIAVIGAFGGLGTRSTAPPRIAPGTDVDQRLFTVRVLDARAGRIKLRPYSPLKNVLIVRARVTNDGDHSFGIVNFISGVVAEPRPGNQVEPDLMDSRGSIGGQGTTEIHPRLPMDVELVWPLPDGAAPRSVTLALRQWKYSQSFTTDTFAWTVGRTSPVAARVVVPVRTGATA